MWEFENLKNALEIIKKICCVYDQGVIQGVITDY